MMMMMMMMTYIFIYMYIQCVLIDIYAILEIVIKTSISSVGLTDSFCELL